MNLEPIRALLKLAEKATPGPWRTDDYHAYVWGRDTEMVADTNGDNGSIVRMRGVGANLPIEDNLAFILAARNSVPALSQLLEAVTNLEKLEAEWRAQADKSSIELGEVKYSSVNEAYIKGVDAACRLHSNELKRLLHPEDK